MKSQRITSLDSIRGICAVIVCLFHFSPFEPNNSYIYNLTIIRNGDLFVDYFFVLSGFVISNSYFTKIREGNYFLNFLFKRILRLYPLHFFMLILFLIYELLKNSVFDGIMGGGKSENILGNNSIESIVYHVFLIHSLGLMQFLNFNGPSWSISVEFYTYIIFFFLVSIKNIIFRESIILFLIIISFTILYIFNNNDLTAHKDFGIFRCFCGFIFGYYIFLINKKINFKTNNFFIKSIIEILCFILLFFYIFFSKIYNFTLLGPLFYSLSIFVLVNFNGIFCNLLKINFLKKSGDLSYSIYMVHYFIFILSIPILQILKNIINIDYANSFFINDLIFLIYLTIVILTSNITNLFIEKKLKFYLEKRFIK